MKLQLDNPLIESLPYWFRDIPEFQQIIGAEQPEFDTAINEMTAIADNFFFQTMDTSAVEMWEQIFGIIPNPATEDLDFRRRRALNRISTRPPFTLGFLYQKLDEIIGPGQWEVEVDYPNYTLYIDSSAENQLWANEVAITLNKVKPAHIVYRNRPYTTDTLLENEQIDLTKFSFNYRLGAWLLGSLPFGQEESLGVIKMPTQKSIQSALLNGSAENIVDLVASARVNGTISITQLTKSAAENVANISYTVTQAQAAEVTLVELLDAGGEVLTSSGVYVPITEQAIFRHSIKVEEGTANA